MKGITSNYDLIKLAKLYNIELTAVIYKNELTNYNKNMNGSYIIDLHDSKDSSTGHWVSLYKHNNKCIYFDSFGIIYPNIIKEFCKPHKIDFNTKQIQSFNSDGCGDYCLMFLYNIQRGKTLKDIQDKFNQF